MSESSKVTGTLNTAREIPISALEDSHTVVLEAEDSLEDGQNGLTEWLEMDEQDECEPQSRFQGGRWLAWGLGLTVCIGLAQWGWFVYDQWTTAPGWGIAYTVASICMGIGGISLLAREWSGLIQLRQQANQQNQALQLRDSATIGNARKFCTELARQSGWQDSQGFLRWQQACTDHHTDAEVLTFFEQMVLLPLDRLAQDRIVASSSKTAVLVATSPFMLLDMLIVLWRNFRLIGQIARIYGVQPGYWGRIRLVRNICQQMVFAGLSELAIDLGHDWLSSELTAKLSLRAAQGIGSGLLSARLGLQVMQNCRPVPWTQPDRPRLSHLRPRVWKQVQKALGKLFQAGKKNPAD